jgi:hypothetical protein
MPFDPAPLSDFDPEGYRASESTQPEPLEPAFETTGPSACAWVASVWDGPVHVAPETEAFASVYRGRAAAVALPEGDASQGARVTVEVLGVHLSVLVAARDLGIHLKKTKLFDGYVWAGPGAPLRWTRASAGRIAYELLLPARVTAVRGPPQGEQRCSELSFDNDGDDAALSRALLGDGGSVLKTHWRGSERVPLARGPERPPLAFLDTRAECDGDTQAECDARAPEQVIVLERRAQSVRIAYVLETVVVVGWVPASALQGPLERVDSDALELFSVAWDEPVDPFGTNDPTLGPRDAESLCAWNAPLAVEIAGTTRTVGTLASAIPLRPRARRRGWREVVLEHPALSFTQGARSWVPERLLYPCPIRH